VKLWLATGLGLGRFPFGGTLASLAACFFAVPVAASAAPDRLEFAALAAAASLVCLATGGAAEAALGRKDPTEVVADEFAGMWLAFALAPPGDDLLRLALAFGVFRFLDGAKPLGLKALQKTPGAAGILVDDLVAGAVSGGILLGLAVAGVP
jgi:phosphatidylglycerophosphatase A